VRAEHAEQRESAMERITYTFTRQEEHPNTWRYHDPFVGALDVRKVDLPYPPPERITVVISESD
jgi:hypothetical protein